jgi:hypothetical protein
MHTWNHPFKLNIGICSDNTIIDKDILPQGVINMASMSEYTELQIIKHALMYYIGRPNASENDLLMETHLLNKTAERIEVLKDHCEIKKKRV